MHSSSAPQHDCCCCTLQVDYDNLCNMLRSTSIQVTKSSQLFTLTNHMTYHLWGSVAWAESVTKIEDKVTKAIRAALAGDKYDRIVLDAFNAVFERSTLTPLKLKRFASLRALLLSELLPAQVARAKKAADPVIDAMRIHALEQLNFDVNSGDMFQKLDSGIRGCIIRSVIAHVKNRTLSLPESFQLEEDEKARKKRARLNERLAQIATAIDKITYIEEAISIGSDSDFTLSPQRHQVVPDFSDLLAEQLTNQVAHQALQHFQQEALQQLQHQQLQMLQQQQQR